MARFQIITNAQIDRVAHGGLLPTDKYLVLYTPDISFAKLLKFLDFGFMPNAFVRTVEVLNSAYAGDTKVSEVYVEIHGISRSIFMIQQQVAKSWGFTEVWSIQLLRSDILHLQCHVDELDDLIAGKIEAKVAGT